MNTHSLARPTDPQSSHDTATIITNRRDRSRPHVLHILRERGPLTLDELTTACEHRWPGEYTPQRYRTASKRLREEGLVEIVDRVARPGKACKVILLAAATAQAGEAAA